VQKYNYLKERQKIHYSIAHMLHFCQ